MRKWKDLGVLGVGITYYYVSVNGGRAFVLLAACFALAAFIMRRRRGPGFFASLSLRDVVVMLIMTFAFLAAAVKLTQWANPRGLAWTDEIRASYSSDTHLGNIPSVDQLCDTEGNRRFHSYEEYRQWFYTQR